MRPRFSVVLPVQDRADNVARATVSVLAQTFRDVELVVVDMGCTDGTMEAVHTVADQRVRVVGLAEPPAGRVASAAALATDALVAGLDACRGRSVAVIDADTAARPHWLARCGLLLDRTGADAVFCGGAQHHRDGTRSEVLPRPHSSRPGAFLIRPELLRDTIASAPDGIVDAHSLVANLTVAPDAGGDGHALCAGTARTPEPLLDWFDDPRPALPEGDQQRLQWAVDGIDVLSDSPIPDVRLLARYATVGGVAAAGLRRHRQARALLAMARRLQPGELKPLARWAVAGVPSLSDRIWATESGSRRREATRRRH